METNEWKIIRAMLDKEFPCFLYTPEINAQYNKERKSIKVQDKVADYIAQNFIPISELKRWVEENEKKRYDGRRGYYMDGHNSALKALKDKFIKE